MVHQILLRKFISNSTLVLHSNICSCFYVVFSDICCTDIVVLGNYQFSHIKTFLIHQAAKHVCTSEIACGN